MKTETYKLSSGMNVNNRNLDFHSGSPGLSGYFIFEVDGIDVYFFFSGIVKQLKPLLGNGRTS